MRRIYCHRGIHHYPQEVIDYINEKLQATWSPEQISCTPCELPMPSWRTIYRWIYEKYLVKGNLKVLRRKGKSHGKVEKRGKYSHAKSIRKRDKSVYSRKEAGHWERIRCSAAGARAQPASPPWSRERHAITSP